MPGRLKLVAAFAFAVAGCATEEGFKDILNSYVGSPDTSLLTQWGPPDEAYSSDSDTKYLTYAKSRSGYVPGLPPTYQTSCSFGICTTIPVGGSPVVVNLPPDPGSSDKGDRRGQNENERP